MDISSWFEDLQAQMRERYADVNRCVRGRLPLQPGGIVSPSLLPGGVGLWAGFEDLSKPRGQRFVVDARDAGATFVVFTPTNDASKSSWRWQPPRKALRAGMEFCASEGLKVVAGPWARADVGFMAAAGKQIAQLFADLDLEPVTEWDVEGSYEVTFRGLLKRHGGDRGAATRALIDAYLKPFGDKHGDLSATLLYFNRPGGDALLRDPRIREAMIQVYSVILGGKKFKATSGEGFQPDTLQRKGWDNYDDFKDARSIDVLGQGLGYFGARERLNPRIPVALQMSNAEACLKARAVTLEYADKACLWAAHTAARDTGWRELFLRDVRFLASGGVEETKEDAATTTHLAAPSRAAMDAVPDGIEVQWDRRFIHTWGRIPDGYRRLDRVDDPMGILGGAAQAIAKAKHKIVRPRPKYATPKDEGTYTPAVTPDGDRYLFLNEGHGATFRRGKRVTAEALGLTGRWGIRGGITVLEHEGNKR